MTDSATFTTPEADDDEDLGELLLEVLAREGERKGLPPKIRPSEIDVDQIAILNNQKDQTIDQP